jgi:lipopolysaccharide biosynthesis regulator YciM
MTTATKILVGMALALGLIFALRPAPPVTDPRISLLEAEVESLSVSLEAAARQVQEETGRREAAEERLAITLEQNARVAARTARQLADAERVLGDTAATAAALRQSLVAMTEQTRRLLSINDSLSQATLSHQAAADRERVALRNQLAVADSVMAAQRILIEAYKDPDPCRLIGPIPCPSRTATAVLTLIGTVTLVLLAL